MDTIEDFGKFYQYAFPMLTVLVTTVDADGSPNIITISWQTTLSKSPPLYGISVAPQRFSHQLISQSKAFVVNFISRELARQVHYCGTHSGRSSDKIAGSKLSLMPGNHVSVPRISEAYAHLECTLVDAIPVGDHTLFVGEVVGISAKSKAFRNHLLDISEVQPLYYRGKNSYVSLDKQFFQTF